MSERSSLIRLIQRLGIVSAVVLIAVVAKVRAHGLVIDVLLVDDQLAPFSVGNRPVFAPGLFLYNEEVGRILTDSPGLGVTNAANGVPISTQLGLDVVSSLGFFDGQRIENTDSKLQIASPSGSEFYLLDSKSPPQTGMIFGKYTGDRLWESHGFFFLSPNDSPPGIYGAMVELTSPTFESSDPFLLPLVYDPSSQFDLAIIKQGLTELNSFFEDDEPANPNDLNADGEVDASDIDFLCQIVSTLDGESSLSDDELARLDVDVDGTLSPADVSQWLSEVDSLAGDTDLDGTVSFADFLNFSRNFGATAEATQWSRGDFDCNQSVDFSDFLILSRNFGQSAAAGAVQSVPEPTGAMMCLLAPIFLRRKILQP